MTYQGAFHETLLKYHGRYFEYKPTGDASVPKFLKTVDELLSHPKWTPGTPVLIDESEHNLAPLSRNKLLEIRKKCISRKKELGHFKCSVVVACDLNHGIVSIAKSILKYSIDINLNIFMSRQEALEWLLEREPVKTFPPLAPWEHFNKEFPVKKFPSPSA